MEQTFYIKPKKSIRDLIHGYIELTDFELSLIDKAAFQRLKDIRQLTCQHVYPDARHTRFEHSLGVFHLTKRAIHYLNKNKFIVKPADLKDDEEITIFDDNTQFNLKLAALLHDVGHCPFSHMGETQLNLQEIREEFKTALKGKETISEEFKKIISDEKNIGSAHEQLSCIAILVHYYDILRNVETDLKNTSGFSVDFELIFRCILGIKYKVPDVESNQKYRIKNIAIELINSKIFDMDKLDYIMRDSFYTGIGSPTIDVARLFQNMFVSGLYNLTFSSKAVPVLQNMIETRDNLYMYVYNHHAVIYSDFIYTYIFRRMCKNAEKYQEKSALAENLIEKGIIPKDYFFSVSSIIHQLYSDCDILRALNFQYRLSMKGKSEKEDINRALVLVQQLQNRQFLKPFWKNLFEYSSFMDKHFGNGVIRKTVGHFVCDGGNCDDSGEKSLKASEFCSQLAKHVIYVTQFLNDKGKLPTRLEDGDFFIVKRNNSFLTKDSIGKLEIHIRKNAVSKNVDDVEYTTDEFYVKYLTSILPQKDFNSIYDKHGFYIYVKPYVTNGNNSFSAQMYYERIEDIFAFVANEFIMHGEQWFVDMFQSTENVMQQQKIETEMQDLSMKYLSKIK